MTPERRKFCNLMHYAVKGHLIKDSYSDEEVERIGDSYMKRLWGNCERMEYVLDDFEKLWKEKHDTN